MITEKGAGYLVELNKIFVSIPEELQEEIVDFAEKCKFYSDRLRKEE